MVLLYPWNTFELIHVKSLQTNVFQNCISYTFQGTPTFWRGGAPTEVWNTRLRTRTRPTRWRGTKSTRRSKTSSECPHSWRKSAESCSALSIKCKAINVRFLFFPPKKIVWKRTLLKKSVWMLPEDGPSCVACAMKRDKMDTRASCEHFKRRELFNFVLIFFLHCVLKLANKERIYRRFPALCGP